jgi:hypothetical protein
MADTRNPARRDLKGLQGAVLLIALARCGTHESTVYS